MKPHVPTLHRLSRLYPAAHIRGRRIVRDGAGSLGRVTLNAATAEQLGCDDIGWFVGEHPGIEAAIGQLCRLDAVSTGGIWIVVPYSRDLSLELFHRWPRFAHVADRPDCENSTWHSSKVWVAVPEDLWRLSGEARSSEPGVAGIIVLDPNCIIYMARAGTDSWGRLHRNDRPQHIVNFRAELEADGWRPLLVLVTERPALAINTEKLQRTFCLNALHFIAGDSFVCWEDPIECDDEPIEYGI